MSVFLMGWGSPMAIANRIAFKHISAHPRDRLVNLETNVPDTLEAGHWDEHFAKNSGLPGPYDFGPMRICWCGHAVTDWMGDDGFLKRLSVRLRRPNFVGDTTWVHGKVVRKYQENNEALVDCELWCDNQRNEVTAFGQATVVLPVRGH
jgi:acyl dehydratase